MKPCNRAAASACDTFTMFCTHPTSPDVSQDVSLEQEAVSQIYIYIYICQPNHHLKQLKKYSHDHSQVPRTPPHCMPEPPTLPEN